MKRRGFQLSRWHRLMLYAASLSLFVSGSAWAWLHHLDEVGTADENLLRLKQPLIAIHGISAMTFVLLLGTLLSGHVRRAWYAHKNRGNGVVFLSAVGLLTLTEYALYYLSNETTRRIVSQCHLWLGLAAPILLFWHIRKGRQTTRTSTMTPSKSSKVHLRGELR